MSNIYITEPPTNGKVLLRTSVGEIEIELWSKESPKAARNFVQLCMEGYYENTVFHRLVPDFIVQGGDPTGSGEGGESIYGKPFRTETHSRLRFNRRGLVAMASAELHDNRSQFFFTLAATPELDRKHSIFGKVVGNTLYNMLNLGSGDVDQNEKPVYLQKIFKTEVLSNPFPDIEPRVTKKASAQEKEEEKPKSTARATKNFKLLSFGEEAEEEEEELSQAAESLRGRQAAGKSSHDLLDDPRLSKAAVAVEKSAAELREEAEAAARRALEVARRQEEAAEEERKRQEEKEKEEEEKERVRREIASLRKELRRPKARADGDPEDERAAKRAKEEEEDQSDPVRAFMMERQRFKEHRRGGKKGARERETMALFESFRAKLMAKASAGPEEKDDDEEEEEEEKEGGMGQMDAYLGHRMVAEEKGPVLAMDASSAQDHERYDLYDPRNPLNKRRRDKEKKAQK